MKLIATTLLALTTATAASAQTTPIPPPTSGILINYTYWPTQYIQFVSQELPYTMFELDVDASGKQQLLYATLTDRATGKRIHYTDSDALIATARAQGEEAHKTAIAFEGGDTTSPGSIVTVRFSMADGKPLQWRFVQGSEISEQGSGLTDLSKAPIPIFAYREQGAVAGEGTALQIGDVVSTADVWKEISHPPQFIAYHGALTQSAHTVVFMPGKESWSITSAPSALAQGAIWELDSDNHNHRTLKIEKLDGTHAIISGSDRFQPAVRFTLDATLTANAWTVASIRYAPLKDGDKHFANLQLSTPNAGTSAITVSIGKKKPIASGTVTTTGTPADRTSILAFTTPTWAQDKTRTEETITSSVSLITTSKP